MSQPNEPDRPNGFLMWLGHYNFVITLVAALLAIAADLAGNPMWALLTVSLAWFVAGASGAAFRHHNKYPCIRCWDESPLTASDPDALVERRKRELAHFHSRTLLAVLALLTFAVAIEKMAFTLIAGPDYADSLWLLASDVICASTLTYNAFVFLVHRRLAQWCPHCRRGGGGGWGKAGPSGPTGPRTGRAVTRTPVVRLG